MPKRVPSGFSPPPKNREYDLRLYVAGATPKSVLAFRNLERLCEEHLAGRYHIEIIDLMKSPQLAQHDQILAVPTVVRKKPSPIRKVVGNLSDAGRVLIGLDFGDDHPKTTAIRKGASHAQ